MELPCSLRGSFFCLLSDPNTFSRFAFIFKQTITGNLFRKNFSIVRKKCLTFL